VADIICGKLHNIMTRLRSRNQARLQATRGGQERGLLLDIRSK